MLIFIEGIKSERPFSVKSNNSSSQREGFAGVLSWDSISVASLGRQEFINVEYLNSLTQTKRNSCIFDIIDKNKELKGELHKSRKNNATLRSKVNKCEKETSDLRIDKLELINKIEKLEKARDQDKRYMDQQESEIQNLHKQLRNHSSNSGQDLENENLREALEKVIEVKMKYENIIKALVDNPKIKPYVARILEKK